MHSVCLGQAVRIAWIISPLDPKSDSMDGNLPGLLNPAWVETLMGLPPGWSSPIAKIDSICSATA